jgi:leader peptidase (prepilin peptidase)/N-methyltransferase
VIDWQTTLLPDTLTGALLWMGLLSASLGLLPISASQSILGAVAGYASLWLLASSFTWITHKEGMGGGDFKLLGGIGAWLGWSLLPWVAFGASVLGLLVAVVLMGLGRMKRTDYLPFGPMLSMIAALVAWVGSDTLLDLTFGLLGR